jgi:hypothetical protein
MAWVNWSRKPELAPEDRWGRVGLDLNTSRVRAVILQPGRPARRLPLDGAHEELPLALSLERRQPEVGRAGLALRRRLPHLACLEFLPGLGLPREWAAGRTRLTASDALAWVFERLRPALPEAGALAMVLPAYLSPAQVTLINRTAERARLALRGTATLPLALAACAGPGDCSAGSVLVVDADDHALSASLLAVADGQARLAAGTVQPRLGLRAWKDRLLDALADRCIRICRRDPRDNPAAEQALDEQIDDALDRLAAGQNVGLTVRAAHWFQEIEQRPEDVIGYCAGLARQAVDAVKQAVAAARVAEPPGAVWVTAAAGRLPGLVGALHANMTERTAVHVLAPDCAARAAAELATRWLRGELPAGHLDYAAPVTDGPASTADSSVRQGIFGHHSAER